MSKQRVVCVLGMHRSGTSAVTRVVNVLGIHLGPEGHLMRPSAANPAGHWESLPVKEINDEILDRFGGSWSRPPELPPGWELAPELADARRQARELIEADFADAKLWGFKDPRLSLTAPFWQRLVRPMRYLICLRNPLDVAASLAARDVEPIPVEKGLELWLTYTRAALGVTSGHRREFVFYEDLMADPETVVKRLARFIGTEPSDAAVAEARDGLWHHRTAVPTVVDNPQLPFGAKALYLALRLFVERTEGVDGEALEILARYGDEERRRMAALEADRAALARVTERLRDAERLNHKLEERLAERGAELERIAISWADEELLRQSLEEELAASRAEVERLAALEAGRGEEEPTAVGAAGETSRLAAPGAGGPAGSLAEIRERARELVPAGSTVLVAAKGDDALLELDGSRGLHFPATADGRYLGYHPAGDTAVIAQLEAQRARGADHLLLPAATLWWLDHYEGFRRHLEQRYERLFADEHCAIFRLSRREERRDTSPIAVLAQAVDALRVGSGLDPSVLDWDTGRELRDNLPETLVFAPPAGSSALPYLDGTVDVVVLAASDERRLAEARRVAARAVITVDANADRATLEWLPGGSGKWGEDVSVTLLPGGAPVAWAPTVGAVAETLGNGFAGELTVVGDGAALGLPSDPVASDVRVRSVEFDPNASLAKRAQAAVNGSDRAIHVLVTAPAVPLGDWLPPMVSLLGGDREAGVVGARILSDVGEVVEAGGVLDGSRRRRRGEGDSDPDRPQYRVVQRVDFCSSPLLATRRDVFRRLKGFDERHSSAGDAVVDFSLRAGQSGAAVYYQPQASVVALGEEAR